MARYHEIAEDLRRRIRAHEFPVGAQLPGISALQEHYKVPPNSLNTVRKAQQLLVADGMLRTQQGVGVFVTSAEPVYREVDVVEVLHEARDRVAQALAAIQATAVKGVITIDLNDRSVYYVLDEALREFAGRARWQAQDKDPDDPQVSQLTHHAKTADRLLDRLDTAWA